MRVSRAEELKFSKARGSRSDVQKQPNPAVFKSLATYNILKQRLYDHFFHDEPLNINNKAFTESYNAPYQLMNGSDFKINSNQKFKNLDQTFLEIYRNDLRQFADSINEKISFARGLRSDQLIVSISKWINTYTRFNHWIYRTFMAIERNAMITQGHKLYFEGIKILKAQIIDKIYSQIYAAIMQCLDLFKLGKLREYEPLQTVIKSIGIIGFTKYRLVEIIKNDDRLEYSSKKEGDQHQQNPYDTAIFKEYFIARLIKDLKFKYTQIINEMMQLSTSEYFEKARDFIQIEERTADCFYGFKHAKDITIRNIFEILIVQKAEDLLKNDKSGFVKMMKEKDTPSLANIFAILKKASMTRVFCKEFQGYVQTEGQQILNKISSDDEKSMKKQTIISVFGQIIQFNELIEKTRKQIDVNDLELHKAQTIGFQIFCNTSNKISNFLAYYADLMLKKPDAGSNNSQQLISQVGKISKYIFSYDYFMKMHQKLLGLRLLYDNFKNQEAEFALIGLLKNEAGLNATSKITNMISDHKTSEALNAQFQLRNKFGYGFEVMMLTSGAWEINDPKCGKSLVPPQLLSAVEQYQIKFIQKMSNRYISWIFTHGRAIVQIFNNLGSKFILILNNYQMMTLLCIQNNQYKPIQYGELLIVLKIQDEQFFKSSLMNLLKYGVLVKPDGSVKIQSKTDGLSFNFDFKYKTQKVGCIVIPRYTDKNGNISPQVSAQRCIIIDAAIVKIMKQRRKALYSEVVSEVQNMCKTFKAQLSQIKLRIQNCQQRQFLQRGADNMNLLIYKP